MASAVVWRRRWGARLRPRVSCCEGQARGGVGRRLWAPWWPGASVWPEAVRGEGVGGASGWWARGLWAWLWAWLWAGLWAGLGGLRASLAGMPAGASVASHYPQGAQSGELSRGGPGYCWDGRLPRDTPFCPLPLALGGFCPLLSWPAWHRPPSKASSQTTGKVAAGLEMAQGPPPPCFFSRRRGGLQPQRLCCWPVERQRHLPPPWGGVGGGVRGLSAQPRWRGGFLRPL